MKKIFLVILSIFLFTLLFASYAESYCPMPQPRLFGPSIGYYHGPMSGPIHRSYPRPYYYDRYHDNSDFMNVAYFIISLAALSNINNQNQRTITTPINYVQTEYGAVPIEVYEKFMKNKE